MGYEIEIEGISPLIWNKPDTKENMKRALTKSDREQAETRAYRTEDGNLALLNAWIKSCICNYYVDTAPNKMKNIYKNEIFPRVNISPLLIDIGETDFDIRKQPILIKQSGRVANIEFPAQPIRNEWSGKFILETTMDMLADDVKKLVEKAGKYNGLGSNRINGYGRFKVTSFKRLD